MIPVARLFYDTGIQGPVSRVVDVSIESGGLPYDQLVVVIGLDAGGVRVTSGWGIAPLRVQGPETLQFIAAWGADGEAIKAKPPGQAVALNLSFDGGVEPPSGDPAEISSTITLRAADGAVQPAARDVLAVQRVDDTWRVVGSARSDGTSGDYAISGLIEPGADVFLMALDDVGSLFIASSPVDADELIRPSTPNGYVYRVVTAGTLPAEEPQWWTTGQQQAGTATLEAREYLRPLAHGPVPVTFL